MRFLYKNKKGQILVEYLLLMVVAVGLSTLLTKAMISRKDGSSGMIIKAWDKIIKSIGNDLPDCSKQTTFTAPNCPQ